MGVIETGENNSIGPFKVFLINSSFLIREWPNSLVLTKYFSFKYFIFYLTVPGKPEVSVEQPKDAVLVSWTLEQKNGIIKDYHVTYIRTDDSSETETLTTKKMEQQFRVLKAGKTYEFQVLFNC